MPLISRLFSTFRSLFRKEQLDCDLDQELQAYLELLAEDKVAAGLSPAQARRHARLELGGKDQVKENVRDIRRGAMIDSLIQDIRYGVRILEKRRGFTLMVVLTLALGIGANTAIYSFIDAALLASLPVENPHELVILNWTSHKNPFGPMIRRISGWIRETGTGLESSSSFSYPIYEEFRKRNEVFTDVFAFTRVGRLNVSVDGKAELASGQLVSGNFFSGLGLNAPVGRLISADDDRAGAAPVAVVTHGYWQRRFGGDSSVIGKNIFINSSPFTIVGVTPPKFEGIQQVGSSSSIFVPIYHQFRITRRENALTDIGNWWLQIMGRLKPGTTPGAAQARLDLIMEQIAATHAAQSKPLQGSQEPSDRPRMLLTSGRRGLTEEREELTAPVSISLAITGLILLITCANVANLFLARSSARRKEIAMRLSLGAGRMRVIRQLLTESTMLALVGGLLSLGVAYWGRDALMAELQMDLEAPFHTRVFVFAAGLSLLTGLLFGLAPAFRTSGLNLLQYLKVSSPGEAGGTGSRRGLSRSLVVVQVAMSLVLLIGAGLFVRTLQNLERVEPGFNPDHVLVFGMDPTLNGYKEGRLADLYRQVRQGVEAIPGARSATLSVYSLLSGNDVLTRFFAQGKEQEPMPVYVREIEPNFRSTMEIPLLLGRDLKESDDENAPKVALVNETLARKVFPGESPVGRRFGTGKPGSSGDVEIVGLLKDSRNSRLRGEVEPTIYLPYRQGLEQLGGMTFSVRTSQDPSLIMDDVRRIVAGIDKNVPIFEAKTLNRQIIELSNEERIFAQMAGLLGFVAMALTCIGLYGILSYTVIQRTREIGVRMALGAQKHRIIRLIMREMLVVLGGAAVGLAAAVAGTRFVSSMLFGLTPTDAPTFLATTIGMIATAAMAVYLPARKAARVDPIVALRYE